MAAENTRVSIAGRYEKCRPLSNPVFCPCAPPLRKLSLDRKSPLRRALVASPWRPGHSGNFFRETLSVLASRGHLCTALAAMPAERLARALEDPAIRNGIKFALAGTLSLGLSLLLRLPEPTWAVTTAFVLSAPKFVGAIGEKTALRILGALAGAAIGIGLVTWLEPARWLLIAAMGLLVSGTTAMYRGTLAPYGFRQCGYTATLVAAQGIFHPELAWETGAARCEEICLGIVVTMAVTTLLWPRYASAEFQRQARGTLGILAGIFRRQMELGRPQPPCEPGDVFEKVGGSFARLRDLIRLGRMESKVFRDRRSQVDEIVAQLGALSAALSNFGRTLPAESVYRRFLASEAGPLHAALALAMDRLADPQAEEGSRQAALAEAARRLGSYQARLHDFRRSGLGDEVTVDESLDHAGYALSLHEICQALTELAALLPQLGHNRAAPIPEVHFRRFALPSPEGVKAGLRGGFSVALGLLLLVWLQPPGGSIMLVGMYLFTIFSMDSADRRGDLAAFPALARVVPACAGYFVFLLACAPLLSFPVATLALLAAMLFLAGYALERGVLGSFGAVVALLMVAIFVSLHDHLPVTPEEVAAPLGGLFLAVFSSAAMRRFLWPLLPQDAFRAGVARLLALLEKKLSRPGEAAPMADRAEVALHAADCGALIEILERSRVWEAGAAGRYRGYLRALSRLGGHLLSATGAANLPPGAWELYHRERAQLFQSIGKELALQHGAFEKRMPIPSTREPFAVRDWVAQCRSLIRSGSTEVIPTYLSLGLLYRIEQIARHAREAATVGPTLRIRQDLADRLRPGC